MRWLVLCVVVAGCTEKPKAPASPPPRPVPVDPLVAERARPVDGGDDGDALYTVKPFTFVSEPVPAGALPVAIAGSTIRLAGQPLTADALKAKLGDSTVVLLSFDEETYLAQAAPVLALLDDARAKVWLQSPDAPALAWPVKLRDEPAFAAWLDESVPGKLRIVQRADGFELQTNLGKLPGGDPKGPTVPVRGGKLDLVTLQTGLDQINRRFHESPDVCFLPSYATSMHDAIRAVATNWLSSQKVIFGEASLVYPRPRAGSKP